MTITERCADPSFQKLLSRAHPRWWTSAWARRTDPKTVAETIVSVLCDGKPNENHPEYRALVSALERVKIADLHGGKT